jgi:hypothetical protein
MGPGDRGDRRRGAERLTFNTDALPLHLRVFQAPGAPKYREAEWPSRVLSQKMVIYSSGVCA